MSRQVKLVCTDPLTISVTGQVFTETAIRPHVTSRGHEITLRTWTALCPVCSGSFEQEKTKTKIMACPVRRCVSCRSQDRDTERFKTYLRHRRLTDTPAGDFVRDALDDATFPDVSSLGDLMADLAERAPSDTRKDVQAAARVVWRQYEGWKRRAR